MGWLDIFKRTNEIETLKTEITELKEQVHSSGYDPDVDLSASGGGSQFFSPLSRSERELSPFTHMRALQLAFTQYESNPAAKAILEITRDYVLGEGVVITATDPVERNRKKMQRVVDAFWNDDVNVMDIKLFNKVLELGLFGEQCYPVTVNPVDGHVQLGYIDPIHIIAVIRDPLNVEIEKVIKVKPPGINTVPEYYKVVSESQDPNDEWYGRLETIEEGESFKENEDEPAVPFKGSCFYFAINKVTSASRGRSDLLSLIDWLDAYDQMLFNEMDRATLLKNFIWDVTMTGGTDKTIDDYKQKNPQPKPGAVRYHSDKVKWEAVTPDLKTTDAQNIADLFLSYIGTGARMPKTWLNGIMDVNRASATELGEPAFKRLTARQKIVRYGLMYMIRFVLDQAEMRGVLPKRKSEPGSIRPPSWNILVTMPALRPRDLNSESSVLVNTVRALTEALSSQIIDMPIAQEVIALAIAHMGIDFDLEQMQKRLEEQAAQMAMQQQQQMPTEEGEGGEEGGSPPGAPQQVNQNGLPTWYNPQEYQQKVGLKQ